MPKEDTIITLESYAEVVPWFFGDKLEEMCTCTIHRPQFMDCLVHDFLHEE